MRRVIALATGVGLIVLGLTAVGGPAGAAALPSNGKIAFYRDGQGVITIDPDGTHERQIDGDVVLPSDAPFSPDGSKLLVLEFLDVGVRPATVNPDGSGFTLLNAYPHLKQHLGCEFWSPDGDRLLCITQEDVKPVNGLYSLRSSDGGGLKRITTSPRAATCAKKDGACFEDNPIGYSPDGSAILFNRQKRSTHIGHLCIVKPDGTGLRRLTPPQLRIHDVDPGSVPADWSPDGSQVAFIAFKKTDPRHKTALYVVNVDGSGLRRITPPALAARYGTDWSPDGQRIAFSTAFDITRFGQGAQIWTVHPDGTDLRQITFPGHGDLSFVPEWSPDGTSLLFQSYHPEISGGQGDLWTSNANGSGSFQLTDTHSSYENTQGWGTAPLG